MDGKKPRFDRQTTPIKLLRFGKIDKPRPNIPLEKKPSFFGKIVILFYTPLPLIIISAFALLSKYETWLVPIFFFVSILFAFLWKKPLSLFFYPLFFVAAYFAPLFFLGFCLWLWWDNLDYDVRFTDWRRLVVLLVLFVFIIGNVLLFFIWQKCFFEPGLCAQSWNKYSLLLGICFIPVFAIENWILGEKYQGNDNHLSGLWIDIALGLVIGTTCFVLWGEICVAWQLPNKVPTLQLSFLLYFGLIAILLNGAFVKKHWAIKRDRKGIYK